MSPTTPLIDAPAQMPTAAPNSSTTVILATAPTSSPTVTPSAAPTSTPTATPTVKPTSSPTVNPTAAPTWSPTVTPTADHTRQRTTTTTPATTSMTSAHKRVAELKTVLRTLQSITDPSDSLFQHIYLHTGRAVHPSARHHGRQTTCRTRREVHRAFGPKAYTNGQSRRPDCRIGNTATQVGH